MEELVKHARALLLLAIQMAQTANEKAGSSPLKVELLLADAGFSHQDIAKMLAKSKVAVAKAVSRGRAARQKVVPEVLDETDQAEV